MCRMPQGVILDITGSSRLALLGGNGAGKSTLLNLLSGDLMPNAPPAGFVPTAPKTPPKAQASSSQVSGMCRTQKPT